MSRRKRKHQQPLRREPDTGTAEVWDLPTRLSHWAIAILFLFQFTTGQFGWLPDSLHLWAGYMLIAVVLFRLQWGLVGPASARFTHFLARPATVWRYLLGMWDRRPSYWPGHNPLGGWSSAMMLLLLASQAFTGLFVETWAEIRGPLAERVPRETAIFMGDLHGLLHWPLLALILVHVAAALFYLFFKRENRIQAIFLSGRLRVPHGTADIEPTGAGRAWLVGGVSLALTAFIAVAGPID